ncbi:hypothetical protein BDP27DRAFT_1366060 [Rhodocollybia butyracea]|uniref:Uncharacterized protein n=1 Tax=Rhodocollybia butyracea TaxID=206335 RepID=A0A9P5U4F9_9AGAR|nr:hypothetical protein BDP27DRAFT_1366060 [Rhodocollybia butyracea]
MPESSQNKIRDVFFGDEASGSPLLSPSPIPSTLEDYWEQFLGKFNVVFRIGDYAFPVNVGKYGSLIGVGCGIVTGLKWAGIVVNGAGTIVNIYNHIIAMLPLGW